MIPREILKKIRQIEIRTNHIVPVSPAGLELLQVAAGMEDRQNHDAFRLNEKVNHKREAADDSAANFSPHPGEPFGLVGDLLKVILDSGAKLSPQAFTLAFIPGNRIVEFVSSDATKNEAAAHLRYFASSLVLTSPKEITSLGRSRCSWRRRSMSSASPGVSSCEWMISFQRLRHNSTCSANGRARASLRTVSELMESRITGYGHFARQ